MKYKRRERNRNSGWDLFETNGTDRLAVGGFRGRRGTAATIRRGGGGSGDTVVAGVEVEVESWSWSWSSDGGSGGKGH